MKMETILFVVLLVVECLIPDEFHEMKRLLCLVDVCWFLFFKNRCSLVKVNYFS